MKIVHGDIKPTSLLVQGNNILLAGFAGSYDWSDSPDSRRETDRGTGLYAAPEVMGPEEISGNFSDLWSLGCVFLEMVTVLDGVP